MYERMSIEVLMCAKASEHKRLLDTLILGEALIVANGPTITSNVLQL